MIPSPARRIRRLVVAVLVLVTSRAAAAPVSFVGDVAPVLQRRCLECHREGKARGRYRLDTFESLMRPGSGGDSQLVPGDPAGSLWMRLITTSDPDDRMPQDADPLPEAETALLGQWIAEGARFDGADPAMAWSGWIPVDHPDAPSAYPFPVPVAALAFSPDGTELATGGWHEVLVWGVEDGRLRRRLGRLPRRIRALSWHPDGEWLAVAGGSPGQSGEVRLVRAADGGEARTLMRTSDEVLAAVFSPDGTRLITGGTDGAIDLFGMPDGGRRLHLAHHADWVQGLAWKADGAGFASASRDRTARVVSAGTGEGLASFTGHGAPVAAVAFSADGKWVWSGGRDGVLRAWDAEQSDSRRQLAGHGGGILAVAVAGGRVYAAAADGRLRVRAADGRGDAEVRVTDAGRLEGLAVAPGAGWAAAGSDDGRVWLWRLDGVEPVRVWTAMPGREAP